MQYFNTVLMKMKRYCFWYSIVLGYKGRVLKKALTPPNGERQGYSAPVKQHLELQVVSQLIKTGLI